MTRRPAAARRGGIRWLYLLIPLLVLAAYGHTLPYDFQFDDNLSIENNAALDHPDRPAALWRHRPSRFVLYLSLALNTAVTGRTPSGLRAVNVVIHTAAALLVGVIAMLLARSLAPASGSAAPVSPAPRAREGRAPPEAARSRARFVPEVIGILAAAIFAVHPIATQAVTYLIQRTASLAALWELAAVALFLRARAGGGLAPWIGSWTAALLAALTKEMSVALPVLILLIEWTLRRAPDRKPHRAPPRLAWLAPYALVWVVVVVTARLPSVEGGLPAGGLRETAEIPRLTYALTQTVVIPRYLGMIVWPRGQNVDHDVALHAAPDGAVIAGIALLALVTLGAWMLRRRHPLVWLGWLWFAVAMLPESSVFPIRDVMFEHRVYLPFAGIAWALAALLAAFAVSGGGRWLLPAALVLALTAATHVRNRAWADKISLWSDAAAKAPRKPRTHVNLGIAYERAGRFDQAEAAFRRALELDPDDLEALMDLARIHGMRGRYREALALEQRAEKQAPDAPDVLTDLGTTWTALGDTARAIEYFERALAIARRTSGFSPRAALVARHAAANLELLRSAWRGSHGAVTGIGPRPAAPDTGTGR